MLKWVGKCSYFQTRKSTEKTWNVKIGFLSISKRKYEKRMKQTFDEEEVRKFRGNRK